MVEIWIDSEVWQPSLKIRFVIRNVKPDNVNLLPSKKEKILQQLYTSNLGGKKWIDVPIEIES